MSFPSYNRNQGTKIKICVTTVTIVIDGVYKTLENQLWTSPVFIRVSWTYSIIGKNIANIAHLTNNL